MVWMGTVLWNFCSNYVYLCYKWGSELDLQGQEKKGVAFNYIHLLVVQASFMSTQHKLTSSSEKNDDTRFLNFKKTSPRYPKLVMAVLLWPGNTSSGGIGTPTQPHKLWATVCPSMGYARVRVAQSLWERPTNDWFSPRPKPWEWVHPWHCLECHYQDPENGWPRDQG